jgi:hypothetical protein
MSEQAIPSNPDATSKPTILLLSLDHQPFFDTMYSRLIDSMSEKATLKRAKQPTQAVNFLSSNTPHVIFITDLGLLKAPNSAALEHVVSYVRAGGTAVIGGLFSSFVRPTDMGKWFRVHWGLPWRAGDYHRTTVYLNSGARRVLPQYCLHSEYSQKAVFLKNVASDAAWYLPSQSSRTESLVFPPTAVDGQQTPVAFTAVGEGWLGYVGDVNAEEGSDVAVLAMCGLME